MGAMKGRILAMCPQARIVDISHDIEPQGVAEAAWCLVRSTPHFPSASIHLAVVDPGVGSQRPAIMLKSNDGWYVGPDNGVFTEILRQYGKQQLLQIHSQSEWWQSHHSFDGLALFAPVAACLANGIDPEKLGRLTDKMIHLPEHEALSDRGCIRGEIIMFDRFGNAITNIASRSLEDLNTATYSISAGNLVFEFVSHYSASQKKQPLALINSDSLLELALFCDSVKERLNLKIGDSIVVK